MLDFEGFKLKIIDTGGERSQRRTWIHEFDGTSVVIFTVDISAWDRVLLEDESTNRTQEDLLLFNLICNSRWLKDTHMILVFTKMDVLKTKVLEKDITDYLTDFKGDKRSVEDVKAYYLSRFCALIQNESQPVDAVFVSLVKGQDPAAIILGAVRASKGQTTQKPTQSHLLGPWS